MTNFDLYFYIPFILIGFTFSVLIFYKIKETLEVSQMVKSKKTNKLQDISSYLNKYIELHSEINGEYLISPISKTKCVKYKVEVYYSLDHTKVLRAGGMDLMTSAITEQKQVDSVYIIENGSVISIDLDEQKKVYMRPFEWHLLNLKEKSIVESYLNAEGNKHFVESLGLSRNSIFGVRESIIPHGEKIYLLGKVLPSPPVDGDYVKTQNNYKFLPYTLKGHIDSVSEKHFLIFLRKKILFLTYMAVGFSAIPLIILFSLLSL